MTRDRIEGLLDRFEGAVRAKTLADVNAARCQTRHDWKVLNAAEDHYHEVRDQVLEELDSRE
jgi:hypothetical protein